jgi:hypothetical protein
MVPVAENADMHDNAVLLFHLPRESTVLTYGCATNRVILLSDRVNSTNRSERKPGNIYLKGSSKQTMENDGKRRR